MWRGQTRLHWPVEVSPGEAHDDERQRRHAVKPPLGKTEVVDEDANVCWNNVENSQKALEQMRPGALSGTEHRQTSEQALGNGAMTREGLQ